MHLQDEVYQDHPTLIDIDTGQEDIGPAKGTASNLVVYGVAHASVDAACAGLVFSLLQIQSVSQAEFFYLAVLYNLAAFGLQPFIGLISDRLRFPRFFAASGCLLVIGAITVFPGSRLLAIISAGLGNALFHIGGGSISLNLTPRRASGPGIFVAPGAIGLFAGTVIGRSGHFESWTFMALLSFACVLIASIKPHRVDYNRSNSSASPHPIYPILLLLLASIAIRSFIGLAQAFPWRSDPSLAAVLVLAIALGKGLGGVMADRWGWIEVSVAALVISSPLITLGSSSHYLAIAGMFLFNMTMPVTLAAISNTFPGRPGFSFGMTCLALIIGAFPTFMGTDVLPSGSWSSLAVILISAGALFFGLRLYYRLSQDVQGA